MGGVKSFHMLGYKSDKFVVEGIKEYDNDFELGLWIKCLNCNEVKMYKLSRDKTKLLRCKHCNNEEILVPKFSGSGEETTKGFMMISRHLYKKYKSKITDA